MEYVLAMATGDVDSRPKGGWAEYHSGEHVMPGEDTGFACVCVGRLLLSSYRDTSNYSLGSYRYTCVKEFLQFVKKPETRKDHTRHEREELSAINGGRGPIFNPFRHRLMKRAPGLLRRSRDGRLLERCGASPGQPH